MLKKPSFFSSATGKLFESTTQKLIYSTLIEADFMIDALKLEFEKNFYQEATV